MSTGQREAAATALLSLVANAYAWKTPPARRLVLWSDDAAARSLRPMAFIFEGGNETTINPGGAISRTVIEARIFVYTDCSDRASIGASELNQIADALDAAMALKGADLVLGRNTLGGAAYWARIEGNTLKVPGDLDGDGIMVVPIKITLP